MKKHRKKVITLFAVCMFAMMMMLNVNTTKPDSNCSVNGLLSLAYGTPSGPECSDGTWHPSCAIWEIKYRPGAPIGERVTCTTGGSYSCSNE